MLSLLWTSTPAPEDEIDPNIVTPGVIGFILTICVAIAVVLLVIDMTRRLRRLRYRAEANERLDAEEAEAASRDQ